MILIAKCEIFIADLVVQNVILIIVISKRGISMQCAPLLIVAAFASKRCWIAENGLYRIW